jgi:hypothetical protein
MSIGKSTSVWCASLRSRSPGSLIHLAIRSSDLVLDSAPLCAALIARSPLILHLIHGEVRRPPIGTASPGSPPRSLAH